MKHFSLRILIAISTFWVGTLIVMFWYFESASQPTRNEPVASDFQVISPQAVADQDKSTAWQRFLSFENQDLQKLDQESKHQFLQAEEDIIGKYQESSRPRLISQVSNAQGQVYYVFIKEYPLMFIPGGCSLRIFLFNYKGKLLNSVKFSSGHRIGLKDIKVIYQPEIGRNVIEVESERVINGRDITKQYYALIGEKILLVRLEDSLGKIVQNDYRYTDHTIGVNLIGRTAPQWKQSLESEDTAEMLAALTWLNGRHLNEPSPYQSDEKINEANLVKEMQDQAKIKAMLKKLQQSHNRWIRDAAKIPVESNLKRNQS